MTYVTYHELVERFGHKLACGLLTVIERASKSRVKIIYLDQEARLRQALDALSDNTSSMLG